MKNSNRRTFIKQGLTAGFAIGSGGVVTRKTYSAQENFRRVVYRDLGSTGFRASEIGFGVLHITDTAIIHAAIDAGINYFDTAHSYMNGKCEETFGRVLETRRKEIFVTTKISRADPADMEEKIVLSLKRLKTDHVDCLLLHGAGKSSMTDDRVMKVFEDAKGAGMTRFVGVSTHDHMEVPDTVAESDFWDMMTIPYNYFSPPLVAEKMKKVREKGIAVVGMKNLISIERPRKPYPDIRNDKSEGITNQQALLKWSLDNDYIDTVIPGISAFEHISDDIAVMGQKLTLGERAKLKRYADAASTVYCRGIAGCSGCLDQCPKGVNVGELNRCLNYARGYGDERLAYENHRRLDPVLQARACSDCETCVVRCVNGLDLTEKIGQVKSLFA